MCINLLGEIPVIFFLYIYHIKCDISKFPKTTTTTNISRKKLMYTIS